LFSLLLITTFGRDGILFLAERGRGQSIFRYQILNAPFLNCCGLCEFLLAFSKPISSYCQLSERYITESNIEA
jgi:hypothetical protein